MALHIGSNGDLVSASTSPITATPVTMAGWVKQMTASGGTGVLCCGRAGDSNHRLAIRGFTGNAQAQSTSSTGATQTSSAVGLMLAPIYHHIAGTFTSITNRMAYANGVAGTINTVTNTATPSTFVGIGGDGSGGSNIEFLCANFAIWSVALSDGEILALANGINPLSVQRNKLVFFIPSMNGRGPVLDIIGNKLLNFNAAGSWITPFENDEPDLCRGWVRNRKYWKYGSVPAAGDTLFAQACL